MIQSEITSFKKSVVIDQDFTRIKETKELFDFTRIKDFTRSSSTIHNYTFTVAEFLTSA